MGVAFCVMRYDFDMKKAYEAETGGAIQLRSSF